MQGLFGINTGTIKNLGLVAFYIKGGGEYYVGGLVGNNYNGTINNSYATGTVDGAYYVGGLVGNNYGGTISNSYSTSTVTVTAKPCHRRRIIGSRRSSRRLGRKSSW